ncbi:uncharacterized protein KQ657_003220 [Scheffersomyces spartinae]|uniref:Uncharacterized protein n=1 Tax=Scheffersomyces spartinae TaxID=45513 RepID=A0A9P7VDE8_9ASCO|nr:uncharacterized protein KQ657_003220 [Scheffersomyces spartinae]KAG7195458.1 hypothetical protein KQ657_003220 [Scheffersomyces spartinae]
MLLTKCLVAIALALQSVSASTVLVTEQKEPTVTPMAAVNSLEKRKQKDVIINKEYAKQQEEQANREAGISNTEETPTPWVRTISETIKVVVTPTVIAGVTFDAKPPKTTNGLEPWVSLKKDGSPKTIKPKNNGGVIKNGYPTYGTYFATPTTITHKKEDIKQDDSNKEEDFSEIQYIDEDPTYHELNPLIRCTPKLYYKKGAAKNVLSEPFCFPHDNQRWVSGKEYFVLWYSKYFSDDVKKVRLHLNFVKEKAKNRVLKREDSFENDDNSDFTIELAKRSKVIEQGGRIQGDSFYSSEWIDNVKGFHHIYIDEEWMSKSTDFYRKVLVSIQPDNVEDDEHNHYENFFVVQMAKKAHVGKGHMEDLKALEKKWRAEGVEIEDDEDHFEKYYVMMLLPTIVCVIALAMYLFVQFNNRDLDLSFLRSKRKRAAGSKTTHKMLHLNYQKHPGSSALPQYKSDVVKND